MAEKKITPKAAEGDKKESSTDKAATRVTKRKSLSRRTRRKSLRKQ